MCPPQAGGGDDATVVVDGGNTTAAGIVLPPAPARRLALRWLQWLQELEASDGAGYFIGKLKRYTWANSSFAHYVADDTHVEIEWKRGAGFEIYENGELTTDGYVSPEAGLLMIRLNEQIEQTGTRIPKWMVSTSVDCQVTWNGYGAELSSCFVTPVLDKP